MNLFVTDFDRTLFIDRKISLEDINSIEAWQKEGNKFVIATGRDINSISEYISIYNLKPDYLICNNGAAIFDKGRKRIVSNFIDKNIILDVIDYIYKNYEGGLSLSEINSKISIRPRNGISHEKDCKKLISYKELSSIGEVYQIHKRFQEEDFTKVLEKDLNSRFFSHIIAYANSHNVDFVAKGVNKSEAIKYLQENLININKIITMGDSYNDLQMILDYEGFIISSAKENLKNQVRNICSSVSDCLNIVSNIS